MKRLFLAAACLGAMLLLPTSAAIAAPHNPTGEYAQFNDCPLSRASLELCVFSESSEGFFTIGTKTVPLKTPQILQGGLEFEESLFEGDLPLFAAEDGNTLPPTPQPVPGGLLGVTAPKWWPQFLQDLFNETINNGFTGVTATVELAAPASSVKLNAANLLGATGTALTLPIKVKLGNPFLGNNCYIGSNSNPINLKFTSGTTSPPPPNEPISGDPGEFEFNEAETIITLSGGRLVDNSFASPGAKGCGGLFAFLIDPFVNSILGVPSAAGKNTAVLEGVIKLGDPAAVKASE
ncbi:MAG TPA: hypothetical protein VFM51_06195 [Solirubrobacterales bacterium]|nr:hypothetical protein [Solirubrobacterales bacterium]